MPAGPVLRTFQGDSEFSRGISAAVNSAPSGVVGAVEALEDAEDETDGDAVTDGDADADGSSVTVFVASGLSEALALLGLSSSRETEQPTSAPPPTSAAEASTAMTERYRVVARVVGMASA
jgi:hypothetical protein